MDCMPKTNASTAATRFTPSKGHLAAAVFFLFFIFIAAGKDLWVYVFVIIPALLVWWALRSSTAVDPEKGITARYAFKGPQSMTWDEFDKLRFEKSRTVAVAKGERSFPLPAVTFNSIPEFAAASGGRIPDVYTEGYEATKDKVRVVSKDGHEVLVSKKEAEEIEKRVAEDLDRKRAAHKRKH